MILGMVLAAASSSSFSLTTLVSLGVALTAIIGALATYFITRRNTSGSVGTSDADTLWSQSQAMLASSQEARIKAETQRDVLVDNQSSQIVPMLITLNTSLTALMSLMQQIVIWQNKQDAIIDRNVIAIDKQATSATKQDVKIAALKEDDNGKN